MFCLPVNSLMAFANGETRVTAQVRDATGLIGPVQQMVLQVGSGGSIGVFAGEGGGSAPGSDSGESAVARSRRTWTRRSGPWPEERQRMNYDRVDPKTDGGKLRITWVRSAIGRTKDQELTIRALGLRRMHDTVEVPNVASTRGMVNAVRHLVTYETIEA